MNLIFHNNLSPGDVLVSEVAIHSLHTQYPGKYVTDMRSPCEALFENNPHITKLTSGKDITLNYGIIHKSNSIAYNFLHGYIVCLQQELNLPELKLQCNRPHVYLTDDERGWVNQIRQYYDFEGKFFVINAGSKNDVPLKQYPYYQDIVNELVQDGVVCVQIGSEEHNHIPLENVINLVGKTTLRELIRLTYHCVGGIGPITFLQHLCGALEKPYWCLAGGRESSTWLCQYPRQQTFHTVGMLSCCESGGCWKSGFNKAENGCVMPLQIKDFKVGRCMAMIDPCAVINSIRKYTMNRGG